ncbi:hypothetical protein ACIHAA_25745 [Streptomyces sp. NPDC052040]|uniref:hypothetical protein n=1 Tax=unclassified Streptomyces TaxID=2593676 RepID=UPI0037D686D2
MDGPGSGGTGSRGTRLLALLGAVVSLAALPLTMASAGPVGADRIAARAPAHDDAKQPVAARSPLLTGFADATAVRCGSPVSTRTGIEAQTCVLTRGRDIWARTYYRNSLDRALSSVLDLMAPYGDSVEMHCVVGAAEGPGVCETPRQVLMGDPGGWTAVAEFARRDGDGPLLLRSGSERDRPGDE